jgi:hypothetical protein
MTDGVGADDSNGEVADDGGAEIIIVAHNIHRDDGIEDIIARRRQDVTADFERKQR